MGDRSYGPVEIPPGFWSRSDVCDALSRSDIRGLFDLVQKWTGASQMRIGAAIGDSQPTVSNVMRGRQQVKSMAHLARVADGLGMPGHAREALGLAPAPAGVRKHSRPPAIAGETGKAVGALPAPADDPASELKTRLAASQAVSAAEVALMRQQLDGIRALDRQLGAPTVLGQLRALMTTMTGLLSYSLRPGVRAPLAAALAEAGTLAGWQALDVGEPGQAWQHYEMAKAAAREAQSGTLLAHAMGEQSFALLDVGEAQQAIVLVGEACAETGRRGSPLLAAWLHAAEAEAHAAARDDASCRRSLDAADAALPADTTHPALPFIFLSTSHLARWRGNCLARLGDPAAVEHSLAALAAMDSSFTRAEAGLRCDLAEAMLILGERDEAIGHIQRARGLALRVGSVRQRRRVERIYSLAAALSARE